MLCRGITQSGYRCQNITLDGYFCHHHFPGSRYISESVRAEVFETSLGQCHHCGKTLVFKNRSSGRGRWEPDHLTPHSQGGSNDLHNLVASCYDCNRSRNNLSLRDFLGGIRYCEAFTQNGYRCQNPVAQGKYKYCWHHS
eukprot:comp22096_c0_seq1/m.51319 comp22096_c0_seq1/g.51319  ORF comp22096_c0_seq1/g.51319 comp22096_c0_seq1/m.51319 type:complete len:140 (+) comp22096_c0_seq1:1117-1536(+)